MQTQDVKIPKARIAVLIGEKGSVKRRIEKKANVKLEIDSEEGDVIIEGDSLGVYETMNVVRAIGRGFNPTVAELLFNEKYAFELIDIVEFTGKSEKKRTRMKGRLIGEDGKSRKYIEKITETHIVVYGKTVALIGELESVALAKQALEMLLEGSPHSNVFRWLENKIKFGR